MTAIIDVRIPLIRIFFCFLFIHYSSIYVSIINSVWNALVSLLTYAYLCITIYIPDIEVCMRGFKECNSNMCCKIIFKILSGDFWHNQDLTFICIVAIHVIYRRKLRQISHTAQNISVMLLQYCWNITCCWNLLQYC